jgi:nucleoside-diphosphate-sugar epimerase
MSRIALITGASGFVGGHLAERLVAEGWRVRALVRPSSDTTRLRGLGAELVPGDLQAVDAIAVGADGADAVFHLAGATTAPGEDAFHHANVVGTRNVVSGVLRAERSPRRLIYASSYAACGPARDGRPRRMDDAPAPLTAYGRTKLAGELELEAAAGAGVECVVLRVPAVYGPGDRAFLPVFRLVRWGLATVPSGPDRRIQLVFVDDLVRAFARAARVAPGTYAVAEPVEHRFSDLIGAMGRALGRRPLRVPIPAGLLRAAGGLAERWGGAGVFSREKAEEMLAEAWVCDLAGSEELLPPGEATPLDRGMAETARWYRTQGWL